ncbi:unnamed protein product [Owenia fusiformis]|uniref:Uncharacterized protein n=1 Tax=Owenia fusiformis TaxID=6347 RepID=A0A8J1TZN4_OWEFU|nr:unnamed protein product [Owenia fusiformis]
MSDDERGASPEKEEEQAGDEPVQEEEEAPPVEEAPQAAKQSSGPTEAMRQMEEAKQRRSEREQEELKEYEEMRRAEKQAEEEEIRKLKEKKERRKIERAEEEKKQAEQRAVEEARRKAEEEERKRKKEEELRIKQESRAAAMKEADRLRNPPKPNFIISKKGGSVGNVVKAKEDMTKSKEQLEEEKKAILTQRIHALNIDGFSSDQLTEKAKDLYNQIYKLESEKYDLEERFKRQQYDMMELAERARQMNKGGRDRRSGGGYDDDVVDEIASKIPGAPPKVVMFSKYERQKDKRSYDQRKDKFKGPTWAPVTERITPTGPVPVFNAPSDDEEEEEEPAAEEVAAE